MNGSTNADRTNYWAVVPTSAVDLALWMESDRLGYLLPALTVDKFENQRDVVLNERRQNYENRPYGLAAMAMMAALYPPEHPYHWMTIGEIEDVRAATLEDVRAFFTTYYHPSNASLTLAGDIDTTRALELAHRYFDEIPSGPAVPALHVAEPGVVRRDQRLVLEDRVELPRLYLAWRSPPLFETGDADLDLLADILSAGKASRLYRALVHDQRIATDVVAVQSSRELSSVFQVIATAAPGHELSEIEATVAAEIDRMARHGPSAQEMVRSRAEAEAHFVYRLQTVGGFGGKSDQLNAYNVLLDDPGYFQHDLDRYLSASSERLQAAAVRYLTREHRVALSVVPRERAALALPGSVPVAVR